MQILVALFLGLSGGIDSAVTLSLAVKALGSDKVTGLIMPFTVTESVDLATSHAKSLSVDTKLIDISDIVSSYKSNSSLFSEQLSEGKSSFKDTNVTALWSGFFIKSFSHWHF